MTLGDVGDAEEADGVFDQGDELDPARRQAAFGFQFGDDFGTGEDVFGAVDLGQHDRGDAGDHGGFQIAHQQTPRAVDPHHDIGAVAVDLRNRPGDQGSGMFLLRGCNRILQVQDDRVGPSVGPGAHEFVGRDRNEHQGPPHRQIVAHPLSPP